MAAGLSLRTEGLAKFQVHFDHVCRQHLKPAQLERVLESDGDLAAEDLSVDTALALERAGPWGQGMPEPCFDGEFEVLAARTVGAEGAHVRYRLGSLGGGAEWVAVDFNGAERLRSRGRVRVVYQLTINRWQDRASPELRIRDLQTA